MASEDIKKEKSVTEEKSTRTKRTTKNHETDMLKKELEELKKKLESQMSLVLELNDKREEKNENVPKEKKSRERNIPFINLTCGTLNLKGHRIYSLSGQFSRRSFPEKEAREIVNNTHNAIVGGLVYIADSDFVEDNDLSYAYEGLFSDSDLKSLLDKDISYVIEMYKAASKEQKRIISDMVAQKVMEKKYIDANILIQLGELTGINYMDLEPIQTEGE